jgi:membrane protein required for colicin V production
MNVIDLLFALLLGWAIFMGVRKGLVIQLTAVLALLLGIYVSFKFSYFMARWITDFGVGSKAVSITSFSLTFIGVVAAARLLGSVADRIIRVALLGWLNRLLGVVFAVVKMTLITSVALFIINSIDKELSFMPREQVQRSKFYKPVSSIAPTLLKFLDFDKVKKSVMELDEKIEKQVESWK